MTEVKAEAKAFVEGTHRARPPAETWREIAPRLAGFGITRIADITGLDRVGIPVFCGVRPRGEILQTSNGKGLRPVDARVSAAMEAIEHWHCEQPPTHQIQAAIGALPPGRTGVEPARLPLFRPEVAMPTGRRISWVAGMELHTADPVWIPAAAVHANALPRCYTFSANGLASGNTLTEATLHALYEIIERDTITRRVRRGLRLHPPAAERVDPRTIDSAGPIELLARIEQAGLGIALIRVRDGHELPVFWAALLDPSPFHPCTAVNFGYGVHLSPTVAAIRAITEAAQARLSFIHGVREDLAQRIRAATPERVRPVFEYFDGLPASLDWREIQDDSTSSLDADLSLVLERLGGREAGPVFRAELTRPEVGIPVVRVLVPGMEVDRRFF